MGNPSSYYPAEITYPVSGDSIDASVLETIFEVLAEHLSDAEDDILDNNSGLSALSTSYTDHKNGNADPHSISHITGLQTALDAKATPSDISTAIADAASSYATSGHTHAGYYSSAEVDSLLSDKVGESDVRDYGVAYIYTAQITTDGSGEYDIEDSVIISDLSLATGVYIDPCVQLEIWSDASPRICQASLSNLQVSTTTQGGSTVLDKIGLTGLSNSTVYHVSVVCGIIDTN